MVVLYELGVRGTVPGKHHHRFALAVHYIGDPTSLSIGSKPGVPTGRSGYLEEMIKVGGSAASSVGECENYSEFLPDWRDSA